MSNKLAVNMAINLRSIQKIRRQPIFFLSLGSKELFHSNFILWLSTIPNGLKLLRNTFNVNDLKSFKREIGGSEIIDFYGKKKRPKADLVGYNENEQIVLVVENKVKDIPNEKQIKDLIQSFNKKTGRDDIKYTILSFSKPTFLYKNHSTYLSYSDFAKKLKTNIAIFKNKYVSGLISDYIKLIVELQKVITSYNITGNYDFALSSNEQLKNTLNDIKLWENYQRVVGESFRIKVMKSLKSDRRFNALISNLSINHQKATINFFYDWEEFQIGVQIEDNQFRRFIYGIEMDENKVMALKKEGIWFSGEYDILRKKKRKSGDEEKGEDEVFPFGSYNMRDKGKFFYQYKLEFHKNCLMGFDDMRNIIIESLDYLLIEENQENIKSRVLR